MTGVRKLAVLGAAGAVLALAVAEPGYAAEFTIGEDVGDVTTGTVGDGGCLTAATKPCTWMNTTAPSVPAASPCNGTVTRWRVNRFLAAAAIVTLRIITDNGNGTFTSTASSTGTTTTADVNEFPTARPIGRGQHVGLDMPDTTGFRIRTVSGSTSRIFFPKPTDGTAAAGTPDPARTALYDAKVVCTSIPPPISSGDITPNTATGSDIVAPSFDTLSESNGVFAPVGVRASAARVKRGTRFRYRLSEASTVRISIFRLKRGRRVGRRCLRATRRRRHRPRCTRSIKKGTLRAAGKEGRNSKFFSGRIRGRALRRGKYKAVFRATDSAGNKSRRRTLRFRIVRPRLRR